MYIWFCNVPLRINSEIKCCILCHSCVTSFWKACMLVVVHLIIYLWILVMTSGTDKLYMENGHMVHATILQVPDKKVLT